MEKKFMVWLKDKRGTLVTAFDCKVSDGMIVFTDTERKFVAAFNMGQVVAITLDENKKAKK